MRETTTYIRQMNTLKIIQMDHLYVIQGWYYPILRSARSPPVASNLCLKSQE